MIGSMSAVRTHYRITENHVAAFFGRCFPALHWRADLDVAVEDGWVEAVEVGDGEAHLVEDVEDALFGELARGDRVHFCDQVLCRTPTWAKGKSARQEQQSGTIQVMFLKAAERTSGSMHRHGTDAGSIREAGETRLREGMSAPARCGRA